MFSLLFWELVNNSYYQTRNKSILLFYEYTNTENGSFPNIYYYEKM